MAKVLSKQTIKQASIIIGVFTICSQLFGLVREAIIANYFGTSAEYDILLVALAIPLMVASILFAAIPSAGIPHLQGSRVTPVKSGNIFRSAFFSINTVLIFGVAVVVSIDLANQSASRQCATSWAYQPSRLRPW